MKKNIGFFIAPLSIIMAMCFAVCENANAAAARVSARGTPATRKTVASATAQIQTVAQTENTNTETETVVEDKAEKFVITNKSSEFETAISTIIESSVPDNSFAEQIRKQRASIAAREASDAAASAQQSALNNNSNICDRDLRKCMAEKCGNDFTKCALDGDTLFGDKLNLCRSRTNCTASEFNLFVPEIRADRDMNVRLASYENVVNCGNQYNACIVNQCGTTYNKCLGKAAADAAIQKCATIARECTESDSGLANRFGTAIGKLRENAEKEVKADEQRMYALRDSMRVACEKMGALFDERTFDCVYTVNFFAGENQTNPTASRKRYAGDTFICMQEWFGINATTFKENAYRETRSQTAASSAMLGSGVGTAVGLISSGAINRAIDTQKAKKELKQEEKQQKQDAKAAEKAQKDQNKNEKDPVNPSKSNSVEQDAKQEAQQLRDDIGSKSNAQVFSDNLSNARQNAEPNTQSASVTAANNALSGTDRSAARRTSLENSVEGLGKRELSGAPANVNINTGKQSYFNIGNTATTLGGTSK